jgi:prepilin-type processing-associated H-X9-DG protein
VGDYAACTGTTGVDYPVVVPGSLPALPNGAFRALTGVRFTEIIDGLSNTLMVGDKHVPLGKETSYPWDCGIYDGHNPICSTRAAGPSFPLAIDLGDTGIKFGSHHRGLCQFVFCDGSVRALETSINPFTLGLLAQRNDRRAIPEY